MPALLSVLIDAVRALGRVGCLAVLSGLVFPVLLGGCASEEVPKVTGQKPITDPISYEVSFAEGQEESASPDEVKRILESLRATLAAQPPISRERVRVFRSGIREQAVETLRALGYYNARVSVHLPSRDEPENRVVRVVIDTPGKPVYIRECHIDIIGEGAFYLSFARIIEHSGLQSYRPLDQSRYEELKNQLRSNALALGFFDAQILTARVIIYREENVADIELVYDTGVRYRYGQMLADDETRQLLLPAASLYNLYEGHEFASEEVSSYIASLNQTGYYRSVDVRARVEDRKDGKVPVSVSVERQPNNLMKLGVGYSTDEGPRVMFGWDKPYLNEQGHSFTSSMRLSAIRQDAQIIYKIPRDNPNLDYYYIRLAQIHTDFNDTLSDLSHASFHYVSDTGMWRFDWSLRLEYEDYTQGSEKGYKLNLMPALLLSHRQTSGGFDPHYGYSVSFDITGASEAITDQDFIRLLATWKFLLSPTPDTRLLVRLQQGALIGPDSLKVPPSLRFFVGGDQSLRGYSYLNEAPHNSGGLKGGRYLSTGTVEYQFPCGIADSRVALFLDAGMSCDEYDGSEQLLLGPGIGFRYISKYGTVKVDLAYGMQHDSGLKLHFSFGPEL